MTEICFVLAPRQNRFFVEVAEALRFELGRLGVESEISREGFPSARDGLVYALLPPHEYRGLAPPEHWPTHRQLERTLFYCFEQPGTGFFDRDVEMAKGPVGAVLDLNATSVEELRRRGVTAHHAPVGWTSAWSQADVAEPPPRDIDVLHLGIYSPRRGEILAGAAHLLSTWRTRLVLGDDHGPNPSPQANFAVGREKLELLARSRVLLNIHLGERRYFEWLRVVQAICNGALVVSEHSTATAPLRAGEHFASARPDALVLLAERYLDDEGLRAAAADDALAFLKDELPLSATAAIVADLAVDIDRRVPMSPSGSAPDPVVDWPDNSAWRDPPLPRLGEPGTEREGDADPHPSQRVARTAEVVHRTTAFRAAPPPVSVLTVLAAEVADAEPTLDSVVASRGIDVELIVVSCDRNETDAAALHWLDAHDDVPALLLRDPTGSGVGAPGLALDFARGGLALVLDPGEVLFPHGLARLVVALGESSDAAFAWGMVCEPAGNGGRPRLRSVFPWQPWRLAAGAEGAEDGSIGRTALWRTAELRTLSSRLAAPHRGSWDSTALYRHAARRGMCGTHVPEIVSMSAGRARSAV